MKTTIRVTVGGVTVEHEVDMPSLDQPTFLYGDVRHVDAPLTPSTGTIARDQAVALHAANELHRRMERVSGNNSAMRNAVQQEFLGDIVAGRWKP